MRSGEQAALGRDLLELLQALKLPVFNLQEAASKISDAVRQGSHAGVSGAARSLFSEPKLLSTLLATGLSSVVLAPIVVHQVTESVPNSDAKEMMSITRDLHSQVSDLHGALLQQVRGNWVHVEPPIPRLSQDIRDLLRSTDVIGGDVRYLINRKEPKVPNGDAGSDGAAMKEVLAKLNDIEEKIRRPVPAASRPDQKEFTEEAVRLTEVKMLVGRLDDDLREARRTDLARDIRINQMGEKMHDLRANLDEDVCDMRAGVTGLFSYQMAYNGFWFPGLRKERLRDALQGRGVSGPKCHHALQVQTVGLSKSPEESGATSGGKPGINTGFGTTQP